MRKICFLVIAYFLVSAAYAANRPGASFLKIAPGSRASGMGGAYTGIADDATAAWWNPAGLATLTMRELSATHAEWLAGMQYDYASFVAPYGWGTLGLNISMLNSGAMESRDVSGAKGSSFEAKDVSIGCTYAKKIGMMQLGLGIKHIEQRLADEKAVGYACDLGGMVIIPDTALQIGYGVYNVGPKMKFISESYHLPLRYSIGMGYLVGGLRISADIHHEYYEGNTRFALGTEYAVLSTLSLRCGYLYNALKPLSHSSDNGVLSDFGLGGGFGLKMFNHQMDYAIVPYGELGATHRISFTTQF